jgi:hypothetical protein
MLVVASQKVNFVCTICNEKARAGHRATALRRFCGAAQCLYTDCLEKTPGMKPLALLVHLPMIGRMVEIGR